MILVLITLQYPGIPDALDPHYLILYFWPSDLTFIMPAHKRPSHHCHETMKTVVWEGKPFHMATREVPKPKILDARDAVVRVTTAAICGSDLHMYHGILGSREVPWAMGHEAMGIVVETGSSVASIKKGNRVVISCGQSAAAGPGHLQLEDTIGGGFNMFGGGKDFGDLGGLQGMKPFPL